MALLFVFDEYFSNSDLGIFLIINRLLTGVQDSDDVADDAPDIVFVGVGDNRTEISAEFVDLHGVVTSLSIRLLLVVLVTRLVLLEVL